MKIMWDLVGATVLVRTLNESLIHVGWGVGIVGSVLYKGYSSHDLDLVVFPYDTSQAGKEVLYMALEAEEMRRARSVEEVHASWHKKNSNDAKHVEVWKTYDGRRVDLFILS